LINYGLGTLLFCCVKDIKREKRRQTLTNELKKTGERLKRVFCWQGGAVKKFLSMLDFGIKFPSIRTR
jgi:hypothetical protein